MKSDYEKICYYIPSFKQYSYQEFSEARMLISSRIFGISIGEYKTDVLAPFADLLNHKRPRQTQWYYDDVINAFVKCLADDYKSCEDGFYRISNDLTMHISLGDLAKVLMDIKECVDNNKTYVSNKRINNKLYITYLSYLDYKL